MYRGLGRRGRQQLLIVNGVGGKWQLCRPDLYVVLITAISCLLLTPIAWILDELKHFERFESSANLTENERICFTLYAGFVTFGFGTSLILRISQFWPKLETGAKIIVAEISIVFLHGVWIAALNTWFWVQKQTILCYMTEYLTEHEKDCDPEAFKLIDLYRPFHWMTTVPNWTMTVIAGIYAYLAFLSA